jgi:hypothetical protein
VRLAGGVLGGAPGVLLVLFGLAMAGSPGARENAVEVGGVALVLGACLGAMFGPSAAGGGAESAFEWAFIIACIAVVTGALAIAALMVPWDAGIAIEEAIVGIAVMAIIGLIVAGLPIAGLVFGVTFVWAALLRAVVSARLPLRAESRSS